MLKVGISFAGQDQSTAPKVAIDVSPTFAQTIQHGHATVVRDVETSLMLLQTGSQIGYGCCKPLFLGLIDLAKMFVQTDSACQLGQMRKVGFSVAHRAQGTPQVRLS